jgi:LPXTG-motif cell wall-anchored protein
MNDIDTLLLAIAALAILVVGAVVLFRRKRIQNGYDEMRKHYGKDWS